MFLLILWQTERRWVNCPDYWLIINPHFSDSIHSTPFHFFRKCCNWSVYPANLDRIQWIFVMLCLFENMVKKVQFSLQEYLNPCTPKSDQLQVSSAASPEILHDKVWRTIVYPDERWLYYQFSLPHLYVFSLKGWENVLFELGNERVPGWERS